MCADRNPVGPTEARDIKLAGKFGVSRETDALRQAVGIAEFSDEPLSDAGLDQEDFTSMSFLNYSPTPGLGTIRSSI